MQIVAYSNILTLLVFCLIWFVAALFLRKKRRVSFVYLLFFTVFFVYLFKVLDYTLFQFQSLLLLRLFIPNLMLNGQANGEELNLVPLVSLDASDILTSFLNILLMIPFGFGLPFITNFSARKVIGIGLIFSISIELLQLATGLVAGMTFRVADVNDVIFNTIGSAIGYILFVLFIHLWRRTPSSHAFSTNAIANFITERADGSFHNQP